MVTSTEPERGPRVAIALQGSFGHERYALGMMAAFQRHKIAFHAASGTVEMMLPLWLYFQGTPVDISEYARSLPPVEALLLPSYLDPGTWQSYLAGAMQDLVTKLGDSGSHEYLHRIFANLTGPAGWLVFNEQHFAQRRGEFERFMHGVTVPIFTNALNAGNFHEVYLYSGPVHEYLDEIKGKKGKTGRREVLELNLDRFIASGARAPILAPIRVQLGAADTHDRQARDEYWMEGAMRCNPPLNPLCDVQSTHILLIRFFARELPSGQSHNLAELLNRYLEVIFTAPLEKEMELIDAMSRMKRAVAILDPAKDVPRFKRLLQEELDLFSHFDTLNPTEPEAMFEHGKEVGEAIVAHYGQLLPTVP